MNKEIKAVWSSAWYELDQSIKIDEVGEFYFFKRDTSGRFESYERVFYNTLFGEGEEVLNCKIISISHPVLGPIEKIDTDGLDYTIYLKSGELVVVNAEESPGKIVRTSNGCTYQIDNWDFDVIIQNI